MSSRWCSLLLLLTMLYEFACGMVAMEDVMGKMGGKGGTVSMDSLEEMMRGMNGMDGMAGMDGMEGGPTKMVPMGVLEIDKAGGPTRMVPMDEMGGMDGIMGKGKGEPKQIDAKMARKVIKEFHSALTSQEALAEFNEWRQRRGRKAAKDIILTIAQKLTKGIAEKYGFKGGFDEAMASVDAAGRRNAKWQKIRDALDGIDELITGEAPFRMLGRVPELDKLAEKFLDMGEAERKEAIAQAEQILVEQAEKIKDMEGLPVEEGEHPVPSGTEYLDAMRGVVDKGDKYIEDSIVALSVIMREAAKGESEDQAEHEKRGVRLSVFSQFTRPKDYKRTNDRIAAMREAAKGESPEKDVPVGGSDEL
eukprot:gnl/TRDRNA2_/TRDRNA2_167522_c0_seq14.p1 gnl/TRDRNA2_/TRDRNA2_167522_c0~~gnl/TRDRNA2_/TRDRNA2_167522_c0_seq14.p1  ORF type:complete len:363 (+),score=85.93 gnl/TRDRNA2_/TRDRNA2_167522_c0_seq14:77-1165(+)